VGYTLPVWIVAALLLVFLMVLPLGRFFMPACGMRPALAWPLPGSLHQRGFFEGDLEYSRYFLLGRRDLCCRRRAARMAGDADGSAVEETDPRAGNGFLRDAAVFRRLCLDAAGRPNAGVLNKLYRAITGSMMSCSISLRCRADLRHGLYSFPYVFSMVANVCELISSDLEDAAEILGANKWQTAWTVTMPLALRR